MWDVHIHDCSCAERREKKDSSIMGCWTLTIFIFLFFYFSDFILILFLFFFIFLLDDEEARDTTVT